MNWIVFGPICYTFLGIGMLICPSILIAMWIGIWIFVRLVRTVSVRAIVHAGDCHRDFLSIDAVCRLCSYSSDCCPRDDCCRSFLEDIYFGILFVLVDFRDVDRPRGRIRLSFRRRRLDVGLIANVLASDMV